MGEFRVGDRVRLKAKPEWVATVDPYPEGGLADFGIRVQASTGQWHYRFPEELELVPGPIKVGDWVTWGIRAVDAKVIAIHGDHAWVEWDEGGSLNERIVPLEILEFVRR